MEFDAHAGNHEGPINGVSAEQVLSTMARASAGAGHSYQLVQATLINWCRPLLSAGAGHSYQLVQATLISWCRPLLSTGAGHSYQLVQATLISLCRPLLPELRSCVKVEVTVLIFLMVSVDV